MNANNLTDDEKYTIQICRFVDKFYGTKHYDAFMKYQMNLKRRYLLCDKKYKDLVVKVVKSMPNRLETTRVIDRFATTLSSADGMTKSIKKRVLECNVNDIKPDLTNSIRFTEFITLFENCKQLPENITVDELVKHLKSPDTSSANYCDILNKILNCKQFVGVCYEEFNTLLNTCKAELNQLKFEADRDYISVDKLISIESASDSTKITFNQDFLDSIKQTESNLSNKKQTKSNLSNTKQTNPKSTQDGQSTTFQTNVEKWFKGFKILGLTLVDITNMNAVECKNCADKFKLMFTTDKNRNMFSTVDEFIALKNDTTVDATSARIKKNIQLLMQQQTTPSKPSKKSRGSNGGRARTSNNKNRIKPSRKSIRRRRIRKKDVA